MRATDCKGGAEVALSNEFKEAVEQGKATRVKIMLKDSLLLDPSCKEFDEMMGYANSKMDSLIEQHDGEQFKTSEEWTEDYLNDEMVAVVNNFSKERVNLLKGIVRKLYANKEADHAAHQKTDTATTDFGTNTRTSGTKITGGVVAVVGAGVLIGGLVIADAPIAVPIIGVVAIGVGAYLFFRK